MLHHHQLNINGVISGVSLRHIRRQLGLCVISGVSGALTLEWGPDAGMGALIRALDALKRRVHDQHVGEVFRCLGTKIVAADTVHANATRVR